MSIANAAQIETPPTIEESRYFDRLAEVDDTHWWSRGMWRIAAGLLDRSTPPNRSRLRALDIGCGAGTTAARLGERREIGSVVALDSRAEAIDLARRRSSANVFLGSALELPFKSASFDIITCFDVYQHLPIGRDRRAAGESFRVLKPGGRLLVRTNARRIFGGVDSESGPYYRLEDLVSTIQDAGFNIDQSTYVNFLPAVFAEGRARLRASRRAGPERGLTIRVPSPAINRLMKRWIAVEAAAVVRLKLGLPFGHSAYVLAEKPAEVRRNRADDEDLSKGSNSGSRSSDPANNQSNETNRSICFIKHQNTIASRYHYNKPR